MYTINNDLTVTFVNAVTIEVLRAALADLEKAQVPDILADTPQVAGVEFVKSSTSESRLGVKTPYNAKFVADIKKDCPSAKWSSKSTAWFVDAVSKPQLYALVQKYFGAKTRKRLTFELEYNKNLYIDGMGLMVVGRDNWSWDSRHTDTMALIEESLQTGGSRNNPNISGQLTIEIDVRDGALIEPAPVSVESV